MRRDHVERERAMPRVRESLEATVARIMSRGRGRCKQPRAVTEGIRLGSARADQLDAHGILRSRNAIMNLLDMAGPDRA